MAVKRDQIMDAVVSALVSIETVQHVSESLEHWEDVPTGKMPACFPVDADETREPRAIFGGTVEDMQATLTLVVTCMIYDQQNDTRADRNSLMQTIEATLVADAGLAAIVHQILPTRITTDRGLIRNYSIWDQEFEIKYYYAHADGG